MIPLSPSVMLIALARKVLHLPCVQTLIHHMVPSAVLPKLVFNAATSVKSSSRYHRCFRGRCDGSSRTFADRCAGDGRCKQCFGLEGQCGKQVIHTRHEAKLFFVMALSSRAQQHAPLPKHGARKVGDARRLAAAVCSHFSIHP